MRRASRKRNRKSLGSVWKLDEAAESAPAVVTISPSVLEDWRRRINEGDAAIAREKRYPPRSLCAAFGVPFVIAALFVGRCAGIDVGIEDTQREAVYANGAASYDEDDGAFQWGFNRPTLCYYDGYGDSSTHHSSCTDAPADRYFEVDEAGEVTLAKQSPAVSYSFSSCPDEDDCVIWTQDEAP